MSDLAISTSSDNPMGRPLVVAGCKFSSPEEIFAQLRTWAAELPKETYVQHFHEALGEVNRAVENYDLIRNTFLIHLWSVGKDTLGADFAKIRKKNRHIWSKAEQAVRTTAKNQRACNAATKKVINRWGEAKAAEFLGINTAQGWRGAAGRLATVCTDYDKAMDYLVHALVQRLQHVGRGKSRYLDPGIVDIQTAINLYKEDPSRPPVASEVLAELGIRRNAMGLLSTGAETIEAPIAGPSFEWASTEPQLSLPQAIIEDLSDLSSDAEQEDAELEDAQLARTPSADAAPRTVPNVDVEGSPRGRATRALDLSDASPPQRHAAGSPARDHSVLYTATRESSMTRQSAADELRKRLAESSQVMPQPEQSQIGADGDGDTEEPTAVHTDALDVAAGSAAPAPPTGTGSSSGAPMTLQTQPTSTQRQKRKREKAPVFTPSRKNIAQRKGETATHVAVPVAQAQPAAAPSALEKSAEPIPAITDPVKRKDSLVEGASDWEDEDLGSRVGLPLPSAHHPETRIQDDEQARKSGIMKDLLNRLNAFSNIDPEHALTEKTLQGIHIYDWWDHTFVNKMPMTTCALLELKRFEHHYGKQLDSYQFALFQQLAESDPVLWLLQALFWSDTELLAFPQGVESVTSHDGILPTICQRATLLPVKSYALSTAMVIRPTLLPVHVILELSKGALSSKLEVVETLQKLRLERQPIPLDIREESLQEVKFIENAPILQGISPLSDAILGRRSYLDSDVQEEIKILLGDDRHKAWEWILDWRRAARASMQLSYKLLIETERGRFTEHAFVF
ncbi:hypothetical protein Asppvi_002248 [Aspergillus pseudoviridinutans]|uniref:Uncharacterized protein n=1 Tax=Aspergillus pseudoviridinutans TaxID=1517512 RepID=A0A9P3B608_9EURO|nr:uncharacterized protein Asppvi_002248 [Aspergillus pseudoviridinutans]GIJ83428.1 hypothetical protein Asppvi_002248 [Aspergillus pseudoviridinutans]